MAAETRIQGIVWEFVHDGIDQGADLSGTISYQSVEVAFSVLVAAEAILYGSIIEVAWMFDVSYVPPPDPPVPIHRECGPLVNPDFSINTYGLRTLSCERVKAVGVEQVPFRLAHQTNLGLRRTSAPPGDISTSSKLYGSIIEVGWSYG